MSQLNLLQLICVWAIPVLFAITVHEVAHGWMARLRGDNTAYMLGRLSLNPIRHVDVVGTLLVPGLLLLLNSGFLFGWAKPVPVNSRYFQHPRRDMAWVALAGPLANLLMALGWGLLMKWAVQSGAGAGQLDFMTGLMYMGVAGVAVNLVLMVLNLLPFPPLDGSRIVNGLLPESAAQWMDRLERYGLFLVVILLATGTLGHLMEPLLQLAQSAMFALLGISSLRIF